jgi:glucose-6-phosphate dehydrogenase assembly protein OpcA
VIIDLPTTNSSKINKALVDVREKGGSIALGRVLTLVIVTEEAASEDPIAAANAASFEHPCRVIVVARGSKRASPRLDAQIRVGGDAGASEVVVLRLYGSLVDHGASVVVPLLLADAPVVVWWPGEAPEIPAEDPIGMLGERRITDASSSKRPLAQLVKRRDSYRPGDTDLAWTRITRWRGLLASCLDQPPHDKITQASVAGAADSPSADLLAAWLALQLKVPVKRVKSPAKSGPGLHSVVLCRRAGDISLIRPQTITAELKVANQPERHVALPRRGLRDCLSEELRRLDADDVYSEVLSKGMALVAKYAAGETKAPAARATAASKPAASKPAASKPAVSKPAADATVRRAPARRSAAAKAPSAPAEVPAAEMPAADAPVAEVPAAKPPAAKPRARATRRTTKIAAAAAGVDDPPALTDDESTTGIAPETDPAAGNGEAPPSNLDATAAPRRRRAASKPAESS